MPWIAETFELLIQPIPASTINLPFGLLGFSDSSWAEFDLPRDLGAYGLPGCTQYVSIEFSVALANAGGMASWQIPIPNDPRLVGLTFFAQALVLDVQGSRWAVVSNAGVGVIGAR